MADKDFGVKQLSIVGDSGIPTIDSPNNLNINATSVAISTNVTIGGEIQSHVIVGSGYSVGIGTTVIAATLTVGGATSTRELYVTDVSTFADDVIFGGGTDINSAGELSLKDLSRIMLGVSGDTPNGLVIRQNSSSNVSEIVNVGGDDIQIQADSGRSVFIGNDNNTNTLTVSGIGATVEGTLFTNQINSSGIITATGGFISVGNTTPVQIDVVGSTLTFTVAGIGSTSLTLS